MRAVRLPALLQRPLDAMVANYLGAGDTSIDFTKPQGEPALAGADSVSWRVFKNPVALFVGGVAAVILELAEPRVRTGVWEHSTFVSRPLDRFRRTAFAAMVTVYGARSEAEKMIAGISRRHAKVQGHTPEGERYRALDPELLRWVQVTASYGFVESYHRFVHPLTPEERDQAYREAIPGARLYGARDSPESEAAVRELLQAMVPRLRSHRIVDEFLEIMRVTPVLPGPLQRLQPAIIRAAVDVLPAAARNAVELGPRYDLTSFEAAALRRAGRMLDHLVVPSAPPALACQRLGLPPTHLYGGRERANGSIEPT